MRDWFNRYNSEITWAIIGWLAFACLDSIVRGNWIWALVDAGLIFINYKLWKGN